MGNKQLPKILLFLGSHSSSTTRIVSPRRNTEIMNKVQIIILLLHLYSTSHVKVGKCITQMDKLHHPQFTDGEIRHRVRVT